MTDCHNPNIDFVYLATMRASRNIIFIRLTCPAEFPSSFPFRPRCRIHRQKRKIVKKNGDITQPKQLKRMIMTNDVVYHTAGRFSFKYLSAL